MKLIMNIAVVILLAVILYLVFFEVSPKAEVVTPEVKKVSDYNRPVREGNCWRQWDTAGNSFLVCH